MIYTLTLNPAVDYTLHIESLNFDSIMRAKSEEIVFGGKGINVSLILKELGVCSTAFGFIGGFTGDALEKGISCEEIKTDFVRVNTGNTRINVKIRDGRETDINAAGPFITAEDLENLFNKLSLLKKDDILVLSGSLPKGVPNDIYGQITERLQSKGVKFILDASGDSLVNALKFNPFLIKPNAEELGEIFGTRIDTKEKALFFAKELQKKGAVNVLVSMGSKGAALVCEDGAELYEKALSIIPVSTVGAGDSMLAGFIAGYIETKSFAYALKLGTACGSATAAKTGLATRQDISLLRD